MKRGQKHETFEKRTTREKKTTKPLNFSRTRLTISTRTLFKEEEDKEEEEEEYE